MPLPSPEESMSASERARHHPIRLIAISRWLVPLILSALGIGYVIWENLIIDGYALFSSQTLVGVALLGVIGPLLAFLTLTLAVRAERQRERQRQHLLALNRIGEAVNQSLELDQVLNRAIDQVLELMRLESGEVRLIENDKLVLQAARRVSDEFIAAERVIPLGQCACGKSAQTGALIAIHDLERHTPLAQTPCACAKFRAVLCVPVRTTDRVVGVIHVASHAPREFDHADRALLLALGHQIGVAIEKARLHAQLKALNQELESRVQERTRELAALEAEMARKADALQQVLVEERRIEEKTRARIAHDLHDGVQQLIIGALFETQAARDALADKPETTASRLVATQDLLRRIETEMRSAIYSLRPVTLDAHGLVPALREYAESFAARAGVACHVSVEGAPRRFSPDAEVAVFRIVQEALNNVETHAHARQAQIHFLWGVRDLQTDIVDDGSGFDFAQVTHQARTQLGLIGMQERAASVGGTLTITSRPNEGTRVSCRVPVN